jgi:hypothetical protein
MNFATSVVYASDGTPYYPGQALVQTACAEGVCHSSYAENASRKGAPHGLNFDVAPLTAQSTEANISALRDGIAHVRDHAGDIWGEVAAGTMPPGEAGKRPEQTWKVAGGTVPADPLTGVTTDRGKATIRNWLACGAPIVAGATGAPDIANTFGPLVDPLKITTTGAPTFDMVYDTVFRSCGTSCHMPGGYMVGLDLSSKATTLSSLIDKAPFAGGGQAMCGSVTKKLIVPGNCKESLVYLKLGATPPCGTQMPPTGALAPASVQLLCDWIDAGAKM